MPSSTSVCGLETVSTPRRAIGGFSDYLRFVIFSKRGIVIN